MHYARKNDIDGVLTAATDYGVLSSAFIASNMDLPGLDYNVAKVIKNKYLVRKALADNTLNGFAQFYEISNLEQLDELGQSIHFPVMVKPCDGSGSKGIRRVDDEKELILACHEAMELSLSHKVLIEDYDRARIWCGVFCS